MSSITSHPPKKSIQDFILDAEKKSSNKENIVRKETLPWEQEGVRSDVQKVFTVKLPEEYILKIQFASKQTNKSQQRIVRDIIQHGVDDFLKQI